jgi:hypothetical protein
MTHPTHAENPGHESTFDFQTSADNGRTWRTHAVGLTVDDAGKHARRIHSNQPGSVSGFQHEPRSAYVVRFGVNQYRWRGECIDCSAGEIVGWFEDHADAVHG